MSTSRRNFLEGSLAALAAAAALPVEAAPAVRRRRVMAADKLRIACVGFGGRGMSHVEAYADMDDVVITGLCDVDTAFYGKALAAIEKKGRPAPKTYTDIRRLLEDKELDAVSIATPNHWHALGAIWAIQAGKDVYVEKPVSHNVFEGRKIVEAARKYKKICQTGTQSRASAGLREAMDYLHTGQLGKISLARGLCYKPRNSIGKTDGPQPIPSTVDYDLWLGPAPKKDTFRKRFHYDWHWQWDYGNGDLGNQGIHEMDKARWGLGKPGFPKHVLALGGRFGYVDDGETPNTVVSVMDYGDCQLIFEVRGLNTPDLKGAKVGNIWYGEKGYMVAPNYNSAVAYDNDGREIRKFSRGGDHFRNFVDAVRSRKSSDLFADIEEGHVSSALCHLGNISYKLGTREPFSSKAKSFGDNKEAYETFGRFEEHLAANGVSIQDGTYILGRSLQIDPAKEKFKGDAEANRLLTREYRAPFVVPNKV